MEFQRVFVTSHRALGIATASVRLSAAPLCKGVTVGLRKSGGDCRTLPTEECDRVEGARRGQHPHDS